MDFYTNVNMLGNKIAIRKIENGKEKKEKTDFSPTLYVPSPNGEWSSLNGNSLAPFSPGNIKETRDFIKEQGGSANFEIHGNQNFVTEFISEEYPHEIEFDSSQIRVFIIDAEVLSTDGFPSPENAEHPITAFTVYDSYDGMYHVFTFCTYEPHRNDIVLHSANDERELIKNFIAFWSSNFPHVVTGWNSDYFDIAYLCRRIENLFGGDLVNKLSPFNKVSLREKTMFGNKVFDYQIAGVSKLDYLDVYKKHIVAPRESYKLDYISSVELGSQKLDYSEYFGLSDLYYDNPQKFIQYNVLDVELVKQLDDKLQLLDLTYTIAYYAKVTFEDTFSPVKTWDTMITEYLKKYKTAVPPKEDGEKDQPYAGAYVKEPKTGFSDWTVSFDLASLYPSLIIQYNIGPDKILNELLIDEEVSIDKLVNEQVDTSNLPFYGANVTPNGVSFSNEGNSIFADLMKNLYVERKKNKKTMQQWKLEMEEIEQEKKRRGI